MPPRGYGPASRPTSRKPATLAAEAAVATADAERTSRPAGRAVQAPSRHAPPSPPPSLPPPPPPPPPPLGPLLMEGGGEQNRTCAVRRARAEGRSLVYGSRKAPWSLGLRAPGHLTDASEPYSLNEECLWPVQGVGLGVKKVVVAGNRQKKYPPKGARVENTST